MGDEEESGPRQFGSKSRIVDSRDDRLPRAGRGHEQVAMMALVASEAQLIEQLFLEGPERRPRRD